MFLSLGQRLRADFTLHQGVTVLQPITVPPATTPSSILPVRALADHQRIHAGPSPPWSQLLPRWSGFSPVVTGDGSVAGQNNRLTAVQVDGASGGDLLGGLKTPGQDFGLRTVAVEVVKEVQVLAAPFDVRYGSFAAGLVNVVTKSGSNRFEGSLSGYFTSDNLVGKDERGSLRRGVHHSRARLHPGRSHSA